MMTSENNATVYVKKKFSDVVHANRLYRVSTAKNSNDSISIGIGIVLFTGGSWLLLFLLPGMLQKVDPVQKFAMLFLFIIGLAMIFDLLPTILLWFSFNQNRQLHLEPYQLIFDETGITIHGRNANANYEWSFYKEGVEGRAEFILIYGKNLYFAIPKASFQSENEINIFRDVLKRKLATFRQKLKIPMDIQWKKNAT